MLALRRAPSFLTPTPIHIMSWNRRNSFSDANPVSVAHLLVSLYAEGDLFHPNEFGGFYPRGFPFKLAKEPRCIQDFAVFGPAALRGMAESLRQEVVRPTPRYTRLQAEVRALLFEQLADRLTRESYSQTAHLSHFHKEDTPFTFLSQLGLSS